MFLFFVNSSTCCWVNEWILWYRKVVFSLSTKFIHFIIWRLFTMRVPKRPFDFFYREIQNFIVIPKRPFVVLQGIQHFTVVPKRCHSFFYSEMQNFENCNQTVIVFLMWNTKFWKLHPNGHLYFPQGSPKSNVYHQFDLVF